MAKIGDKDMVRCYYCGKQIHRNLEWHRGGYPKRNRPYHAGCFRYMDTLRKLTEK